MSKIDYNKIVIQPPEGKSTCQVFVLDLPSPAESPAPGETSKGAGRIFGMIEIEAMPNKKINTFINSLIQEIRTVALGIFSKEQPDSDAAFENLIQKTNYRYVELIGNKSSLLKDDEEQTTIPNISAVLLFESGKNIHLALRGRILPFLIYQTKPNTYKIINIAESASGREGRMSHVNLFTNIINGRMNVGDYLFFSTESILDYFSLEKICKTVSTASPEESANSFRQILDEVTNSQTTFAALILKLEPEFKPRISPVTTAPEPKQISLPQNSMAGLLKTAANTEKMLTPSLSLNLGAGLASFSGKIKNLFKKRNKNEVKDNARLEYYSSQFSQPSRGNKFFKTFSLVLLAAVRLPYYILKNLIIYAVKLLKIIFYLLTNKNGLRQATAQGMKDEMKQSAGNLKNKFIQMPRLSRVLFVSAVIFVFLFILSTALLYNNYQNRTSSEVLSQKTGAIQDKKSAAEASLIYNDEVSARTALGEADALLAEFPQKTKNEKRLYQDLVQEIDALREKLRHVARIDEPTLLADLAASKPETRVLEIVLRGENIYAADDTASIIYKLNLANRETTTKDTSGHELKMGVVGNNSILFYEPERKFFAFNFTDEVLRTLPVILNENEKSINDLALYNQRLYVLDISGNQIWRHNPAPEEFSLGTPWIKGDINLEGAVSIAVDGTIFVVKSNGELIKFGNGQKLDFSAQIDPALAAPSKIWTSAESDYLYILEPAAKRLVVVDKNGKLKIQYLSEKFSDLRDFTVSEEDKKIYLLSGNSVYEIVATHL